MADNKKEDHRIKERISYNLCPEYESDDTIKDTFISMGKSVQLETIRRYKIILQSKIEMWTNNFDDEVEKINEVECIAPEINDNNKLSETIDKWHTWEVRDSIKCIVAIKWYKDSATEVNVVIEIFTENWNTNIDWLKQFIEWMNEEQIASQKEQDKGSQTLDPGSVDA